MTADDLYHGILASPDFDQWDNRIARNRWDHRTWFQSQNGVEVYVIQTRELGFRMTVKIDGELCRAREVIIGGSQPVHWQIEPPSVFLINIMLRVELAREE